MAREQTLAPPDPVRLNAATVLGSKAPMPARLGNILAGTAGWTDPTLIKSKRFYPRGVSSAEDRLRYYASHFPLVEVDSSYYALPSAANAERWVERTPDDFVFNVKAFAGLTEHPMEVIRLPGEVREAFPAALREKKRVYPKDLPAEVLDEIWKRFREAIDPLHAAGKLGSVLLQYPPWFTATKGHTKTLESARERLAGLPVAIEFRHASWGEESRFPRVIEMLRKLAMSYVNVDQPQGLPNSMPPSVEVTNPDLAIIRFHGHKADTWNESVSVQEKWNYLYAPDELRPWVPKVTRLARQAAKLHLVFNNCVSDFAVLGAKDIIALAAGVDGRE